MKKPLDGIRVIDFTRILAGPITTMILGDLEAEIVKVEAPRETIQDIGPLWLMM